MAKIKKIKNNGETIYPITTTQALYSKNGDLLDFLGNRSVHK